MTCAGPADPGKDADPMCRVPSVGLLVAVVAASGPLTAADPVEKHLNLQRAMATARQHLDVNMPAEAVAVLEAVLADADGHRAFLALLREAYLAELYRLERTADGDPDRAARLRRKLALLGPPVPSGGVTGAAGPAVVEPSPPPVPSPGGAAAADADHDGPLRSDAATAAAAAFKRGDYATAARLFAAAPDLTPEQKAAWAYCRLRSAAERLNALEGPSAIATVEREVQDALALVPDHADLQRLGRRLLLALAGAASSRGEAEPDRAPAAAVVETESFVVRHAGTADLAAAVARTAEQKRRAIFARWSGPPATAWVPKCEIILHPSADAYVRSCGRPMPGHGHATVRLSDRRVTHRRLDLLADDPDLLDTALPRELTHVVLADLFPDAPPPKWAETGMAVLAGPPDEVDRYLRTLPRCARDGDWFPLAQLLELADYPREKITGFYCQSVSVTEYLIRIGGGERNFTLFLRDCQRYGTAQALRRQYGLDGPEALERAWKRAVLGEGRGQAP